MMKYKNIILSLIVGVSVVSSVYAFDYNINFDKSVLKLKKEDIKVPLQVPIVDTTKPVVVTAVVPVVEKVVEKVIEKEKPKDSFKDSNIKKYYDSEFDNVCYVLKGSYGDSISCVKNN